MGTSDLIRLAQELAECGGVHRFNNLVAAASHVLLEHERARTVEAWEDGPETGVGMSDKAASGAWSPPPHWSQRGAPSRAPERDGECGGPGGPGTDRGALAGSGAPPVAVSPNWGFAIVNNNVLRSNPAPVMPERGERKPLPQSDCQDERPRGVTRWDGTKHSFDCDAPLCGGCGRDHSGERPRGGISHEPGSPLLKAQDDFGRRERLVPKFDGKRINPEDLGDGA